MAAPQPHRVLKDRRTKNLTKRLRPGDIALIHHADLDTTAARALVDCKVSAVVNAAPSITGRYPNRGPSVLLDAGIPLLDNVGESGFADVVEGRQAVLEGDCLRFPDGLCLHGVRLTPEKVEALMEAARANLNAELDRFVRNTLGYLEKEKSLLFAPVDVPRLKTRFAEKHVLIVVRGEGYKEDLAMLGDYLRDVRPVLLAVDGGADALLEAKLQPDVILGDMDSISDEALRCGAELVVHGYDRDDPRGVPGLERIQKLGLQATVFHAPGTSEDAAMLLADELGAKLIVAVGTHFSLEDFLDKGRRGMASTFLTRLRIGSKLVDAKGIARLWAQQHPRFGELALVLIAAATPIIAVLMLSPMGRLLLKTLNAWLHIRFH
ncbi:MAG TPA: putative cytokinetic ring protein SteA [Chthonomonadaceae bacterium]|nr:putative cytokinetic ring protein SteA [Chthonomonadaceae bacterium]